MMSGIDPTALAVFLLVIASIAALGFSDRKKKAAAVPHSEGTALEEWGLGGRRYGAWVTWFLVGGDLYTAYTVIAVPGLMYATGAGGFFALPYCVMIYPIMYAILPKLRGYAAQSGAITAADVVMSRFGSKPLEIAIATSGVLSVVPYIALQMDGIAAATAHLGLTGKAPLVGACILLAAYTYMFGLKASARIAFAKDIIIYIVVLVAVALIPAKLGGYGAVFAAAEHASTIGKMKGGLLLRPDQMVPYASLALGSAIACFMYPHTLTGVFAAKDGKTIRRNAIALPIYSVLLGMIALMGYMAHAVQVSGGPSDAVPSLFKALFAPWFGGFAFAALAVTALVPAAVMAIGAANLFTRNIWAHLVRSSDANQAAEARTAKTLSIIVIGFALLFITFVKTTYVIDMQLLGGLWILQTFPAITAALLRRKVPAGALLAGWIVGIGGGTAIAAYQNLNLIVKVGFGDHQVGVYVGLLALVCNAIVAGVGALIDRSIRRHG